MGTNYYHFETEAGDPCERCGHRKGKRHIGKSAGGWCFSLHVYPEDGIRDLDDWRDRWWKGGTICDEYGGRILPEEMDLIIRLRSWPEVAHDREFLTRNYAIPGPNGLLRSKIDNRHCVGHGDGPWDLIVGEFS